MYIFFFFVVSSLRFSKSKDEDMSRIATMLKYSDCHTGWWITIKCLPHIWNQAEKIVSKWISLVQLIYLCFVNFFPNFFPFWLMMFQCWQSFNCRSKKGLLSFCFTYSYLCSNSIFFILPFFYIKMYVW